MLYELIHVGSIFFWIATVVAMIALMYSIECNSGGGSFFAVGVYLALIHVFGDAKWVQWMWLNPLHTAIVIASYFAIGTGWSVAKWALFVKDKSVETQEKYTQLKVDFQLRHNLDVTVDSNDAPIPASHAIRFKEYVKSLEERRVLSLTPPLVREHKERILTWMSFWPFSIVWSILDDFVKRSFVTIYNFISTTMQRISNRLYRGVQDQFNKDLQFLETAKAEVKVEKPKDNSPVLHDDDDDDDEYESGVRPTGRGGFTVST